MKKDKSLELPPLPGPVLYKIFSCCSTADLKSCRQTCRLWNRVAIYYNLLPDSADIYFHSNGLKTTMPPELTFSSPQDGSFLSRFGCFKHKKSHANTEILKGVQWLQEQCLDELQYYFTRSKMKMRVVGLEDMLVGSGSDSVNQFLTPTLLPIIDSISHMHIAYYDFGKLQKLCSTTDTGPEMKPLIHGLPNLKHLTVPVTVLTSAFTDYLMTTLDTEFLSGLESLELVFPDVSFILDQIENQANVMTIMAQVLKFSLQGLKSLKIVNQPTKENKLPDIPASLSKLAGVFNELGDKLYGRFADIVQWKTLIQNLDLNFELFPIAALENDGVVAIFTYMAMMGLRNLRLRLEGTKLAFGLPTIISTIQKYGCKIDLDVRLYFDGTEPLILFQFMFSQPEVYTTIKNLFLTFLPKFSRANQAVFLEDILPLHARLLPGADQVLFFNLTSLQIILEERTRDIFFSFSFLSLICPNLKEISIIIGGRERYKGLGRMVWSLIKEGWLGTLHTSLLHGFYVRSILKTFPGLESLTFWGDLRKAEMSSFFIDERPGEEFVLSKQVPVLKKLSLRGLGSSVNNKCLHAFRGMKSLTNLELIGLHRISNSAKTKLMNELPNLREFNLHL